jgi:hypothetical protein
LTVAVNCNGLLLQFLKDNITGTDSKFFTHILVGISPSALIQANIATRAADGNFLVVSEIVEGK